MLPNVVDVARLLLMVPIEPWQSSASYFGAVAFCMTKIDNFRPSLTLTSLTTLSTYSLKKNNMPMPELHTVPALSHLCGFNEGNLALGIGWVVR